MVAEGLTNVVRYAETTDATVSVSPAPAARSCVVVTDDGKGGAAIEGGTGLRGLDRPPAGARRAGSRSTSPPGDGTRLEAHIPIERGSLVAEAART